MNELQKKVLWMCSADRGDEFGRFHITQGAFSVQNMGSIFEQVLVGCYCSYMCFSKKMF